MRFDDRTADSQPQAHAAVLGREKAVEQTRGVLRRDPGSTASTEQRRAVASCATVRMVMSRLLLSACAIACTAFTVRLTITCCSCVRSPRPCADPLQFSGISSGPQGQTMSQAGTLSLSVRCSHSVCFVRHLTRDPVRRPTPALDPITVMWSGGILSCAKGPVAACQAVKLFEMQLANGVRDWRLVLH